MSVRHETRVNHYFSPSEGHLTEFLSSVTSLYEENAFTDLRIIAADAVLSCHQIVLASVSSFIKNLILAEGAVLCPCENLTIYLPDFKAVTLRNLLSILYTGKSLGDCSTDDVKSLISFLQIDIRGGLESPSMTEDPPSVVSPDEEVQEEEEDGSSRPGDEVLEVTPSIHSFMGNHFLASGEPNSSSPPPAATPPKAETDKYSCRLCGKASANGASLFAHLLYPHYAHLWRDEVPTRSARYDCRKCTYVTTKRQHYIMHIARVHDELRVKLSALGENLNVLEGLPPSSGSGEMRIASVIAKSGSEFDSGDEASSKQQQQQHGNDGLLLHHHHHGGEESPAEKLASSLLHFHQQQQSYLANSQSSLLPAPSRLPRGYKPFVKCRLCGKAWKGKDNFFTHLVSTHFKYLWANEVPRHAEMFHCKVQDCNYQSKYRYNFLFHLAGKHKQLKQKLAEEGVPLEVLTPLETDGSEFESPLDSPESIRNKLLNSALHNSASSPSSSSSYSGANTSNGGAASSSLPSESNTKLVCRVCSKVSLNHTCHRQHVVGKHFQHFWAHHVADSMGIFNCPHSDCPYKTPNRSVFVIHLAYVHQELKLKIAESGQDPTIILPDVFGKRKYRRSSFGFNGPPSLPALTRAPMNLTMAAMVEAANAVRLAAAVSAAQQQSAQRSDHLQEIPSSTMENNNNNNHLESSSPPTIPTSSTPSSSSGVVKSSNHHHVSHRHVGYKCVLCKAEFSSSTNVIEHLSLSHFLELWESGPLSVGPASGTYTCKDCDFATGSKTSYVSHLTLVHDGLKYLLDMRDMKIGVLYESVFEEEDDIMMAGGDLEEDPGDEEMEDEEEEDFEEDVESILSFN